MRILFILLLLLLPACASDPLQLENEPLASTASARLQPMISEIFRLEAGDVASFGDGDLLVAFHSVKSDSRCPADVTCVWAGDAELYVGTATEGGRWKWMLLHSTIEPKSARVGPYTVLVVDLEPANQAGGTIPPADYTAVLKVSRD